MVTTAEPPPARYKFDYAYIRWTPEQTPRNRQMTKWILRHAQKLPGYSELPQGCRVDFRFLRKWIDKYHPTAVKAKLLLRLYLKPFEDTDESTTAIAEHSNEESQHEEGQHASGVLRCI